MTSLSRIITDLAAEQAALDAVVAPLAPDAWMSETDSPRWRVFEQIAHLTYFDRAAAIAITDPNTFAGMAEELRARFPLGPEAIDDLSLAPYRSMSPAELLTAWRDARRMLAEASATLADGDRVPWYGPPMSARSFLTARLMEVWAHGADVATAVGTTRASTDRVKHIVTLGVLTRGWSYANRGMQPPQAGVRVELTAPSGELWVFGPDDAEDSIGGAAEDFCLVVTQRTHVDDTGLMVHGAAAREWMLLAQCFAGPASDGPAPATS